jgi:phospho-N-acetylmuramoyl-pentapeptide-transferase
MLVWLLHHFGPFWERLQLASTGDSRVYLTARTAIAAVTSFLVAWLFGPVAIRWLSRRFRERVDSASDRLNEIHAGKNATPTMGGVFIVAAIVTAALVCGDLSNRYLQLALVVVVGFAAIGITDDWIKITTAKRGLTVRQKLLAQLLIASVVVHFLVIEQRDKPHGLDLIWPIGMHGLFLGGAFAIWGTLVVVGSSNGVNLTDGLDGLAGGCLVFAGAAFVALTYLAGHRVMADYLSIPYFAGAGELSILFAALCGSMLGFLWYNCYPAQVFMGDSGSLPTGALLGFGALVTRQEVLLLIVGGVFVVETVSVILQVVYFKLTGKRLIACSPLHNHFLFRGDHEIKIVVRFWITSALLALLAVASLKIQ